VLAVDDLEDLVANLTRECDDLFEMGRGLLGCGVVSAAGIAVQIKDARGQILAAVDDAMLIIHATDFAVRKPDLVLYHIPSARPHRVDYGETLLPQLSAFFIKHRRLRFWIKNACNLSWLVGSIVGYLLLVDVHSAPWMPVLVFTTLPGILMNFVAFNRELLKGIATTFQTALVCGHTAIMIGSFCALFRNQPLKLAAVLALPVSMVCAAFMDAYPGERRAITSRLFFTLSLLGLLALQAGLALGLMHLDEAPIEVYGGWSFKVSELAGGATNNLIPFALRNLVASLVRPQTLAVRESDVVCVYIDEHAVRVLRAVHAFLVGKERGASKQLASSVALGAVGVVVAAV
jgi:hypothetical protein